MGMPKAVQASLSWPATSMDISSPSMEQVPAIRKKRCSRPISNPQSSISGDRFQTFAFGLVVHRSLDEGIEQWMAVPWRGLEFWVELHTDKPGMHGLWQLHNFRELLALGQCRNHQASFAQLVQVVHVGFVAVAVALGHHVAVNLV